MPVERDRLGGVQPVHRQAARELPEQPDDEQHPDCDVRVVGSQQDVVDGAVRVVLRRRVVQLLDVVADRPDEVAALHD